MDWTIVFVGIAAFGTFLNGVGVLWGVAVSIGNRRAITETKQIAVDTHNAVNGQMAKLENSINKAADLKVAAADRRADASFDAGREHERAEPLATGAAVAALQTTIDDNAAEARQAVVDAAPRHSK